ncbi:NAD(P)/FAD-dependent oxidoreductase [Sulfurovum sp. NBC37-1]|uniref:NAD(P)/FAD-dependent oxidoreductase n=1 Tax=Sulfurovum sp. (strain NBC37-1) TaxID=387093 RepID=UPI00015877DA|nr:FAD-dependent oxidoreductase [Sulfurovum sp. NBC37-1]BAF71033.1 sulfide-quinone reductase [Sulfurovum sp. NBC37-1]
MKKVLVLGGGFAGVEAAIYLRKQELEVTLVSDRDFFYIYPTSIWIPTGEATMEDVSVPLDELAFAHGFQLIVDPVIALDAKAKKVTLQSGRVLDEYEYIVVAMGQEKIKLEGMEANSLSICGKPEEATALHEKLDALVQKGHGKIAMGFGGNPKDTSAVRGGPAFEVLFNVDTYLKSKGIRDNFELTFFAPMEKPGQKMGDKAFVMMDKMFKMTHINKKIGVKITAFEEDGILFEDGTKLESDLTMFISAGVGHGIIAESGLPLSDAGFVVTNEYNEIEGFEGIYAIGDTASLMGPEWRAKQGHVAEVMARNVAYNIFQHMQRIDSKHSYMEHLNILCVMDTGNGAAFVYRDNKGGKMIPMPIVGHWMKKGWGWYCRNSKLGKIPRLPGM